MTLLHFIDTPSSNGTRYYFIPQPFIVVQSAHGENLHPNFYYAPIYPSGLLGYCSIVAIMR
jgi:hypothetical protein